MAASAGRARRAVVELRGAAHRAGKLEQCEVVGERLRVVARVDAHADDVHARRCGAAQAQPAGYDVERPAARAGMPSGVTQCAAVITSRGETTTAPQIWPSSVSLTDASMSAAANGQAPGAACWPPIDGARLRCAHREHQTPQRRPS